MITSSTEIHRSGFGPAQADCKTCELQGACKLRYVEGERPADWQPGGLMLIGEGPGEVEISLGRPFVGPSGRLLNALLENAGLDRNKVWLTNSTLAFPPKDQKNKDAFHDRFPMAIYSCLPRLEQEIAAARPRVIVTLGQAALIALTGHEVDRKRTTKVPCLNVDCNPENRKLRTLCLVCASADCDWYAPVAEAEAVIGVAIADEIKESHGGKCPKCAASITRLKPRQMKCPTCGGRKTKIEDYKSFEFPFGLIGREGCAGAVFPTETLSSRLDQFGVKYIIPTYHPSYCLHPAKKGGGEKRVIGGQYAARVCVEHLEKARRLLRSEPTYAAKERRVSSPTELAAFVLDPTRTYAVDIETNSEDGAWACTKITCVGIACAESQEAIVLDTRAFPFAPDFTTTHPLLDELYRFLDDETKHKVFHNAQYDRVVIMRLWGIEVRGVVSDTIISHHALYPDEEQGLGFCAHELLDAPHWKIKKRKLKVGEYDDLGGYDSFDALALYNARDTRSTALIDRVMRGPPGGRGRLDAERVRASHDIDVKMQEISIRMELAGLPLDKVRLAEVRARAEAVTSEELTEMRQMIGRTETGEDAWQPTGKDLLWAMFGQDGPLRLEPFGYTPGGQPSLEKETLARMTDQHPFVARLVRYKKYAYILTNYIHGEALRAQPDGRLHPQWKVYGTVTSRWSSSPNLQNWGKGDGKDEALNLRGMIVAPPGRRLVGADYCLVPGTRIFRPDLSWSAIETLKIGDEVVGFPEQLAALDAKQTYKVATVTSISRLVRPSVKITTDRGEVTCSVEHMWLARGVRGIRNHPPQKRSWTAAEDLRPGHTISFLATPWAKDETREGGWMAGILDGEGWIHSPGPGKGSTVGVGQNEGIVLDRVREYLRKHDFHWSEHPSKTGCVRLYVRGGAEHMRLLGLTQPIRLWAKHRLLWEGRRTWSKTQVPATVLSVEFVGDREVISLGTSTKTFIAEGFLSHNCQLELRIMADLSGDENLIRRCMEADEKRKLEPDGDPHAYMAWRVFGNVYLNGNAKERKILREISKTVVYALSYGSGAQTIMEGILSKGYDGPPLSLSLISSVVTAFFKEYPGVPKWRDNAVKRAQQTREVRSALLGTRRIFPLGDIDVPICFNHPVQGTAANIMNTRLAILAECLPDVDPTAVFIAQVHDAIYIECAEDKADAVSAVVSDSLTCELALGDGPKMLYLASADHAQSWDKA